MSAGDPGVVVKNTFLEVGDHKSLLERSDGWRRQMSEPVKIYTSKESQVNSVQQDSCSELDDEEEDDLLDGPSPPELCNNLPPLVQNTALFQHSQLPSRPPQVLLLADSIPAKRGRGKEVQARKENYVKDNSINNIKNNDVTKKEPPWLDITTVMMRNLPNKYTQQMLLEELQDGGFRLQRDFDFFYLPMDHSNAANLGYCFINFTQTALANAFAAAFQGKKMRRFNSNKTVVVMPASIQGFEKNYEYYSSTRVAQAEDPQYRPLFLRPVPSDQQDAPSQMAASAKASSKGRGGAKGAQGAKGKKSKDKEIPGDGCAVTPSQDSGFAAMCGDWSNTNTGAMNWPVQSMTPTQAAVPQGVCPNCHNECGPGHNFCAFCGSFIGQAGELNNFAAATNLMRADAPAFVPGMAGGSATDPLRANLPIPMPALAAREQDSGPRTLPGPFNFQDSVTDELDVMRGRMMLLAALKDMEQRELNANTHLAGAEGRG